MFTIKRYLFSGPGALVITTGLGLMMASLIKVEFSPQAETEKLVYDINVIPDEEKLITKRKVPILQKVILPPPAPILEIKSSKAPKEQWVSMDRAIPIIEPFKIEGQVFAIVLTDRGAQPIVRIPPIMPPRAERSGHCKVQFDVSALGQTFNVVSTFCTSSMFKRASIKSVYKWKYQAKIVDGIAVSRSNVESKITFKLKDEHGRIIPE